MAFTSSGSHEPFALDVERSSNLGEHLFGVTNTDFAPVNGVPAWNWEAPLYAMPEGKGEVGFGGRVISVKWGDYIKAIGIDGSPREIKEAIRSAFGLRTRRPFWLEDDEGIVRCIGRHMPLRDYTLNLDEGVTIKIDLYNAFNETQIHVEKTFYNEDGFHAFLQRHGFVALKDLDCCRIVDSIDDLHSGEIYQGLHASSSLKYYQLSTSVAQITNFW